MKNTFRYCLLLVYVIFGTSALFAQKSVELGGFNKIEVFGKINVRLEKSTYDSLSIQSGSFDIEQVKFSIDDSVLTIRLLTEFPPSIKVDVIVNFQQLISLKVGGGAKLYNKGIIESQVFTLSANSGCEVDLLVNVDSAIVSVSKGAFVRLTGQNRFMSLKTGTGGDFRSTKLTNSIMVVKQKGGTAEVVCSESLTAKVCFGASLKFVDQPKKIIKKEGFGGTIGKLEEF